MRLLRAVATAFAVSAFPVSLLSAHQSAPPRRAATYCARTERTLCWCLTARRWYALCASADLGATTGSLQYRAGRGDVRELVFPAERRHPRGLFAMPLGIGDADAHGNAGVLPDHRRVSLSTTI